MIIRKFFLLSAISLFLLSPVFASDDAKTILSRLYCPSGQMPVVDAVIELEDISSQDDSGKMSLASQDKIYFKKNCKIRIDIIIIDPGGQLDGKQMTIIRDGLNAFHYLSTGQYPVKKKVDEPSPPLNLLYGLASYPQDAAKTYKILGKENIEGVSAVKIGITGVDENSAVWVDVKRCVPLKLEIEQKDGDDKIKKTVIYKDIGMTKDGRYFPMKLEKYVNGKLASLIVYKALVVNTDLKDDLFSPMETILK